MNIFEVTTPIKFDKHEIGLMTKEEFLKFRNKDGKHHGSDSYQTDLNQFNNSRMGEYTYIDYTPHRMNIKIQKFRDYSLLFQDDRLVAVINDGTVYHNVFFINTRFIHFSNNDMMKIEKTVKVKYLENIISKLDTTVKKNHDSYKHLIRRFIHDGEQFSIRTEGSPYSQNDGHTVVILNDVGYIVAMASDEWGTTLLRTAKEYRGKGLGEILGKIWYKLNPDYMSGGFTNAGRNNAVKIWASRVREFLSNGWYSQLVKDDKISKDKVNEILNGLPERSQKKSSKEELQEKPELLFYSDMESTIIIYDKKFYEDQDEKYIYGHAFLRDFQNKYFIFTIDYDKQFRKLTHYTIFQLAKDLNEPLYIKEKPSDYLEIDDIDEIEIDGDFATLSKDMLPLEQATKLEKRVRKKFDQYGEMEQMLLEIANYKWK